MNADIQPTLTQIVIYPIKSLDGKIVDSPGERLRQRAKISPGGALGFDRRWAIVDEQSKIVNAKRTAKIQQLRSRFDLIASSEPAQRLLIRLYIAGDASTYTFCLTTELVELAQWLSEFFGFPVRLIENAVTGFPDDLDLRPNACQHSYLRDDLCLVS